MPTLPSYLVNFTDPLSGKFIVPAFSTDGSIFPTVTLPLDPSAVNANSSILIYGKGSPNYGERTGEDLLHSLEHFYGATEPVHAVSGQLWFASVHFRVVGTGFAPVELWRFDDPTQTWIQILAGDINPTPGAPIGDPCPCPNDKYWIDTSTGTLYVWVPEFVQWFPRLYAEVLVGNAPGSPDKQLLVCHNKNVGGPQIGAGFTSRWKKIGVFVSTTPPVSPSTGDLWYDTSIPQLMIWSGLAWTSVADRYVLKAGDTMTGPLMISADIILSGAFSQVTLPNLPLAGNDATNKTYVDTLVGGSGDGNITGGSLDPGPLDNRTLRLTRSVLPGDVTIAGIATFGHGHTASDITFAGPFGNISSATVQLAIQELETEKAPKDNPIFTTGVTLVPTTTVLLGRNPLIPLEAATKQYVDSAVGLNAYQRIVRSVQTSTGNLSYSTLPEFTVEANELWVYVNGIKQIQSGRGQQQVVLTTGNALASTGLEDAIVNVITGPAFSGSFIVSGDQTLLYIAGISVEVLSSTGNDGTYTVSVGGSTYNVIFNETTIPVDEAVTDPTADGNIAPDYTATIAVDGGAPQIFTINGTIAITYGALITTINAALVGAEVVMNPDGILVISDTTGALSSISIVDGVVRPLFGSTDLFVGINAAMAGFDASYQEDGTPGTPSTQITFLVAPASGLTFEFMVFRRV